MNNTAAEKIVIVETDPSSRDALLATLEGGGYQASAFASAREGLEAVRAGADLLILDGASSAADTLSVHETLAAVRGSASTERVRVVLLVGSDAKERVGALDLGADDAVSRPWDPSELLARVRTQIRARRADRQLLEKAAIAEEGQKIAHTAFDALAVTEKMTRDAFSLDRRLKIGVSVVLAIAVVMGVIYFLFARNTQKDLQRTTAIIARLERGIVHQDDLMSQARKMRDEQAAASPAEAPENNADRSAASQPGSPASIIGDYVSSVCLLHVSVAFRNVQDGRRLRYAGLNQRGEPLQDSDGNPILTLEGNGPEVKLDVFGTGFPVSADGRILTNRHVAEPWWKNDEIGDLTGQGFQAEISSIHAYFPGDSRAFAAEIENISKETDLATMHARIGDLKRTVLSIDSSKTAAVPGEPVVLMGYATGLAAILARADDQTAREIVTGGSGDPTQVLSELARRGLIHPLITQGHIGDVLSDKIVFDAQTTSGGSGGPLFNQHGKVIGVTYAVLQGFGGSNFGIPIRFAEPLLAVGAAHASN